MSHRILKQIICIALTLTACTEKAAENFPNAFVTGFEINGRKVAPGGTANGIDGSDVTVTVFFSEDIDINRADLSLFSITGTSDILELLPGREPSCLDIHFKESLPDYQFYTLSILKGENCGLKLIDTYRLKFLTKLDDSDKFERIPTDELLTLVQQKTFSYFWDYAHPVSGLAMERLNSGDTVTSGGSGFGIMGIPVGIERGFISREEGATRVLNIVKFLYEKADRFHGAYPHWLNGSTGQAIAFSTKDNGADIVETAFLIEGLLTAREYFSRGNSEETAIREYITKIWEEVEWDWFLNGTNSLFWHWSPDYAWEMNMPVSGWNEALILYILAASSPTHPIDREAYDEGWAGNGRMKNGKSFYDIELPLGEDYGGPLFFSHYSFLGLDPRQLKDKYADYWEQNVAHARINHEWCKNNPKGHYGYSDRCWGLTASDFHDGYTASSPLNDKGTIAPTAALSSFPYTPEESLNALEYFYYALGDRIFGEYGFKDAFTLSRKWFASSYIAIDQGPILLMIENYRSALLWNNFMKNREILEGLDKLGFTHTNQ